MYKVNIDGSTVSLVDINECIAKLELISNSEGGSPLLTIAAAVEIEAFDPLLIAYLMAYHAKIDNLRIVIELPYNSSRTSGRNSDIAYQLFQYRTFAYISSMYVIFDLAFQDRTLKEDERWNKQIDFAPGTFVFSSKFFPILLVEGDTLKFDMLFRTSLSSQLIAKGFTINKLRYENLWDADSGSLRAKFHDFLRKSSSPKDPENSFLNLAYMYFIYSLDQAKIASAYFQTRGSGMEEKVKIGNLSIEDSTEYLRLLEGVFSELAYSTIIHQFMFATLLSDEELRTIDRGRLVLNKGNYKLWAGKIRDLWDFSKDLVTGLIELAKNIMEHCSPDPGAISVRILSLENWKKIKIGFMGQSGFYASYADRLNSEGFIDKWSLVDVNVIDLGKIGVVKKLMGNTASIIDGLADGQLKGMLAEDLQNLEEKKITFSNFLNTSKPQLNQQSKRSIAHFGLLTLSRLVTFNNGLIAGSTTDSFDPSKRDAVCFPSLPVGYSAPVNIGTNYQIVLPIRKQSRMATNLPHNIDMPSETTARDIAGIEQLFDYKFLSVDTELSKLNFLTEPKLKYLIEFRFKGAQINKREEVEMLYDGIAERMEQLGAKDIKTHVICLNFDEAVIDESNLFRLHGMVELNFPSSPVIIYNLPNDTYQNLAQINEDFHQINRTLDYWNAKIPTLVYSFTEVRGNRFNFCDVLFGGSKDDYLYINWLTSFASFNSTAILEQSQMIEKFVEGDPLRIVYPNKGTLFYNRHSVLPFELLLRDNHGMSLFEQNTIVLLKNELSGEVLR